MIMPVFLLLMVLMLRVVQLTAVDIDIDTVDAQPYDDKRHDDNGNAIGLVQVLSRFSFNETYDRLLSALNANAAIKVVAEINHQRNAQSVNLELSPIRLVVFGNPALGTPLMLRNPITGLDLPQTVLVWEETNQDVSTVSGSSVYVGYNSVTYLRARHPGIGRVDTLATVANALRSLAAAATGVNNTLIDDSMDNLGYRDFYRIRRQLNKGLFQRISNADFETTWNRLITALQAAPLLSIPFQVDHAANAPNKDLNPTRLVVFANPTLGTRLMQVKPTVGIDLPLKILVTQDDEGTVLVSTNRVGFLQYRHDLFDDIIDETITTIRTAIMNFVRVAATGE